MQKDKTRLNSIRVTTAGISGGGIRIESVI